MKNPFSLSTKTLRRKSPFFSPFDILAHAIEYVNCNTLNNNLKRSILNFSEKISKNLSRPKFKFVSQMMFGILNSQSFMLSEINSY